jgi:hypothetical protein
MKKALLILVLLWAVNITGALSFADTATAIATADFSIPEIWFLEVYTDPNVLYTTNVPFTMVDPTDSWVESDGREADSTKNDIGFICMSNLDTAWYLKIQGTTGGLITLGKLKYGIWQPWNRNLNQPSDGTIAGGAGWRDMPTSAALVYTSGPLEAINLPLGTLCMFNFAIEPGQLDPTQVYTSTIQFTLTGAP